MAAKNKPNLFIVTPLDWTLAQNSIIDPNWFTYGQFRECAGCGALTAEFAGAKIL